MNIQRHLLHIIILKFLISHQKFQNNTISSEMYINRVHSLVNQVNLSKNCYFGSTTLVFANVTYKVNFLNNAAPSFCFVF